MKFNTSDRSFVRVATHRQEVMMVIASYPGPINRYDLQKKNGALLCNIGEYELTLATDDEVQEALNSP
jgi:uncharacterized protein (AIM24 family)